MKPRTSLRRVILLTTSSLLAFITIVVVCTGAMITARLFQSVRLGQACPNPALGPWWPVGICGDLRYSAIPIAAGIVGLISLQPLAYYFRRWITLSYFDNRIYSTPRIFFRMCGNIGSGIVLAVSSFAGGSWLTYTIKYDLLHIGCSRSAGAGPKWICEGNLYYGVSPLALMFPIFLLVAYAAMRFAVESR